MKNTENKNTDTTGIAPGAEMKDPKPSSEQLLAYVGDYLTPACVGARKGIFVPRSLVNRIGKLVAVYGIEDLTIGAYVTNILVRHLSAHNDVIKELAGRGIKGLRL